MMHEYLVGVIYLLLAVALFCALVPGSRWPVLWSGLAWAPHGMIDQYWLMKDYFRPNYFIEFKLGSWTFGPEDYLSVFAFCGLSAGLFDILVRKKGYAVLREFDLRGFIKLVAWGLLLIGATHGLIRGAGLNSLYAITLVNVASGLFILINRPHWIGSALVTAFVVLVFAFLSYWGFYLRLYPDIIERWWYGNALSGALLGVPYEELLVCWAGGLFIGPVLRYCMDPANSLDGTQNS
ncbi:MAG: hypothetical protein KJ558_01760 [Gammaproteobacteria bacterium]|nr:hypothetical protein [Gammaproteobacteria bacterium]MBU1653560.1 hypothetical protein [Gammaproteobacteria bacterium]MBU1961902.1 hypothetical protein [Gammaproteobacteria bacterium]